MEAMYSENKADYILCTLCPHKCHIAEGRLGACGVRRNNGRKLVSLVYEKAIACNVDPIEKKPLFHFLPGSKIYSYATVGCNLRCSFCQNWDISQLSKRGEIPGIAKTPREIVDEAAMLGCRSIAATYNEPTIQFEYAYNTFMLAKKRGLSTVFVTNGFISKEPIDKLSPYLDAVNIDLKAFSDEFYKKVCGARLKPVLEAIRHYHKNGVWVEVTTLIIPGENDSDEELREIANFIVSVNADIPWHISRFHPDYQMTEKNITPIETIDKAHSIGRKEGLRFIYVGNVFGDDRENSYCPSCGKILIERRGYRIRKNEVIDGECKYCAHAISGRF
jgi:pyruvate formate lyase activating enzyme